MPTQLKLDKISFTCKLIHLHIWLHLQLYLLFILGNLSEINTSFFSTHSKVLFEILSIEIKLLYKYYNKPLNPS